MALMEIKRSRQLIHAGGKASGPRPPAPLREDFGVHSVVREEWTAEVFDKSLMSEYASEERMVNLLQVAIKCVNRSAEARPRMNQVALMINAIREEEERSTVYDPQSRSLL
ncbi:hypothetical protein GBA52_028792 [Prunus armeniaca]|nr:hypothetical protein GBA52_028792 [Prunus armeniaca]